MAALATALICALVLVRTSMVETAPFAFETVGFCAVLFPVGEPAAVTASSGEFIRKTTPTAALLNAERMRARTCTPVGAESANSVAVVPRFVTLTSVTGVAHRNSSPSCTNGTQAPVVLLVG